MKQIIHIINGPNLNLLGKREPEIYGEKSFETYLGELRATFDSIELSYYQSNVEGELINRLQELGSTSAPILINAGGYTHTSVAIADAIAAIPNKVIEVHISQPTAREAQRHRSLIAQYCSASISGFGLQSYKLAIQYLIENEK